MKTHKSNSGKELMVPNEEKKDGGQDDKDNIKIVGTEIADELKFLDEDIAEEFRGKEYFVGTPTNVQLSRDIRKLTAVFSDVGGIKQEDFVILKGKKYKLVEE